MAPMNTSRSDLQAVTLTPSRAATISAVCTAREVSLVKIDATRRPSSESASAWACARPSGVSEPPSSENQSSTKAAFA